MNREVQLRQLGTGKEEYALIQSYIQSKAVNGTTPQVLEAGCGQRWWLGLDNIVLTGVDLDAVALEMRKNRQKDLHHAIQGDLCSVELPANSYDVIYSSFVLEHIEDAEHVMQNFSRWLKPGGIVILKVPDPDSVRGFVTRVTPHWFHVFYYRYFLGVRNAGKPGYMPYRTYYHPIISRRGIREFCEKESFVLREEWGDAGFQPFGRGAVRSLTKAFVSLVAALSFGALTSGHTNLLFIIEKRRLSGD